MLSRGARRLATALQTLPAHGSAACTAAASDLSLLPSTSYGAHAGAAAGAYWQSQRGHAAMPAVMPAEHSDDYDRRLQELMSGPRPQRSRRRLDLAAVPMLAVPNKQQDGQQGQQAQQRQESQTGNLQRDGVEWRQVVEQARRAQQRITGTQMLTDTFRREHNYLRISLTERCNLRCTYCMPAEGVALTHGDHLLTSDEVLRLAALFVRAGVTKIRLTGGEPTIRKDLIPMSKALASLPGLKTLSMTSNGIALGRQLPALREAGLGSLNISLDTLKPERFEQLTRRGGLGRVLAAVGKALELGFDPVKVNVVVMRGVNDDEVCDFVEMTRDAPLNVRFIEWMPFDGNVWNEGTMVPYRELMARIHQRYPQGLERLDDPAGEVAKNFQVPGFKGSVSFITSMTHSFCGDCNRLRLLADGNLKVCLFGANEVSLRDAMRQGATDEELMWVISAAVDRKRAAHAGMFELARTSNRPMTTIGG